MSFFKLSPLSTDPHLCCSPPCLFLLHCDVLTLNDNDRRYAHEQSSGRVNSDLRVMLSEIPHESDLAPHTKVP